MEEFNEKDKKMRSIVHLNIFCSLLEPFMFFLHNEALFVSLQLTYTYILMFKTESYSTSRVNKNWFIIKSQIFGVESFCKELSIFEAAIARLFL